MRDRGFSMVELMIVLAVIGILAAFTTPNLPNWSTNIRLNSSAKEIASTLQLARMKAIAQNTDVTVCFYGPSADFPETKYADGFFSVHLTVTDWCNTPPAKPGTPPLPGVDNPFARFYATVSPLPTGKNIQRPAPKSRFTFNSRGQANAGHIDLVNLSKQITKRIIVHSTGRVRVATL